MQDEWVVCRVFHKNSISKKAQPTSSSQQSDQVESPCDTYTLANDIDLPSFNLATPSIGNGTVTNIHNMNMNLTNTNTLPLLPAAWSNNLPSVNSLLFRALQLRGNYNHQPTNDYPFNIIQSQFGIDFNPLEASSSSMVFDPLQAQAEQAYKFDANIWD